MKSAQLTTILTGLTAFCAVATILLYIVTVRRAQEIGQLQPLVAQAQQNGMAVNNLVAELMEYSKRDAQIKPLLQSAIQPAPAKPVAK